MVSTTQSLYMAAFSSSSTSFSQTYLPVFARTNTKTKRRIFSYSLVGAKIVNSKTKLSTGRAFSAITCSASSSTLPSALLFDCDGVLVDTEKGGHRISFNDTFTERELDITWDVDLYEELLKIGGGKERMTAYFNKTGLARKCTEK